MEARGRVLQINISPGGVPKLPIPFGEAGTLGLKGDKHVYPFHGGRSKALLLIASELIDTLREEGFSVYYGALGENLTTQGLDHRTWKAGQRFRVGEALIELTERRVPCRKLNPYGRGIQGRIFSRFSNDHTGESGFYASVIQPGLIRVGDPIQMNQSGSTSPIPA